MASRKTKLDRVLIIAGKLAALFAECPDEYLRSLAPYLAEVQEVCGPGSKLYESTSHATLANELLEGIRDCLHPENEDPHGTGSKGREILESELPGYFAGIYKRREKLIENGRIRRWQDFSLIRAYADDIEVDGTRPELLEKLYRMLDEYEARQ